MKEYLPDVFDAALVAYFQLVIVRKLNEARVDRVFDHKDVAEGRENLGDLVSCDLRTL